MLLTATVAGNALAMLVFGAVFGALGGGGEFGGILSGAAIGLLAFLNGVLLLGYGAIDRLRTDALINPVLAVEPLGIWFAVPYSEVGELFLPWNAVGPVSCRPAVNGHVLTVRLRPGVTASHPGAVGLSDPRIWRLLTGSGAQVGLAGTVPGAAEVLTAIERYHGVTAQI